jgi:DNA-binding response OmpR family regulator
MSQDVEKTKSRYEEIGSASPIRILAVSSNPQNLTLLERILGEAGYDVATAASLDVFDQALDEHKTAIDLALVDITGFDHSIWSRCERLQKMDTPLLLVSSRTGSTLERAGERYGAASVLVKPLAVKELVNLIGHLVER